VRKVNDFWLGIFYHQLFMKQKIIGFLFFSFIPPGCFKASIRNFTSNIDHD